ncbi:hypothetical protein PIB30_061991 [Stylosanthes scabra]|uniref:Uncharacterized protein n=1 Tax=Stylosanthes scabra TaxID=79078 RepID=A0ABU6VND1_9FABA|nr:hypothetical protein [Stylosanthes scabra]
MLVLECVEERLESVDPRGASSPGNLSREEIQKRVKKGSKDLQRKKQRKIEHTLESIAWPSQVLNVTHTNQEASSSTRWQVTFGTPKAKRDLPSMSRLASKRFRSIKFLAPLPGINQINRMELGNSCHVWQVISSKREPSYVTFGFPFYLTKREQHINSPNASTYFPKREPHVCRLPSTIRELTNGNKDKQTSSFDPKIKKTLHKLRKQAKLQEHSHEIPFEEALEEEEFEDRTSDNMAGNEDNNRGRMKTRINLLILEEFEYKTGDNMAGNEDKAESAVKLLPRMMAS